MKIYTHNKPFNAGQVIAIAILDIANLFTSFKRISILDEIPDDGILIAIGDKWIPERGMFDYNGKEYLRQNKKPFASAGMIWSHYGKRAIRTFTGIQNQKNTCLIHTRIDKDIIQNIDTLEIYGEGYNPNLSFFKCVKLMNSDFLLDEVEQAFRFSHAIKIAKTILMAAINKEAEGLQYENQLDITKELVIATT